MIRTLILIIGTLGLAFAAWENAAASLLSKFSPERGLKMDPGSAVALVNSVERANAASNQELDKKLAREFPVRALRSEPLSARALRQLGTYYSSIGERERGRDLIQLSARVSRRDPTGQLWLADDHVRRRQAKGALEAIDAVIRTEPQTREAAYRVLGSTLADPEFRSAFVSYAKTPPSWLQNFIEYNVSVMEKPQILSRTLMQFDRLPVGALPPASADALVASLANRAPINEVRSFYLTLPNASESYLTSLAFTNSSHAFRHPPIGWQLVSDSNVQGFGNVNGGDPTIEAIAMPGRAGIAARKLLFLQPGTYRWTGTSDLGLITGDGTASMRAMCYKDVGKWETIAERRLTNGSNELTFSTAAASCEAVMLAIHLGAGESQTEAAITLTKMRLGKLTGSTKAAN